MNYELAVMALEGLSRSPAAVEVGESGVEVRASAATFRELARLCLLLGSDQTEEDETLRLDVPIHLSEGSLPLTLRRG